jgi:ribosomal protein S5
VVGDGDGDVSVGVDVDVEVPRASSRPIDVTNVSWFLVGERDKENTHE